MRPNQIWPIRKRRLRGAKGDLLTCTQEGTIDTKQEVSLTNLRPEEVVKRSHACDNCSVDSSEVCLAAGPCCPLLGGQTVPSPKLRSSWRHVVLLSAFCVRGANLFGPNTRRGSSAYLPLA